MEKNKDPIIVRLVPSNKTFKFYKKMAVFKLLEELNLNPESVVVLRDGTPLTKDLVIYPGDKIDVISVISGGKN